jgi:tetraacyldisaccharide 4'-kinase
VISVGNLSVGGSGKTPVVARVAEILRDDGLPVAILSRGYRGSFRGEALVVGDGSSVLADAAMAGDEPVMLARALEGVVVAVGPRRDRVGRAVEARFGPRVHVLDDGFQHLRLARDLDLVCVAPGDLSDVPLPAGRLREAPAALERADAILLADADGPPPLRLARQVDAFQVSRRVLGFFDLGGEARPTPARPFLLSGIARPERFEADVRAHAGSVAGSATFADHHRFTAGELREALDSARSAGADAVVTTAKDAVRLPVAVSGDLPLLVLRIEVEIADAARFRDRLLAAARRAA